MITTRILIFHASVGTGHKSAAKALDKAFQLKQIEQVWCEDALDYGSKVFRDLYVNSYLELSEKAPTLWYYFYDRADKSETEMSKDLRTLIDRVGVTELAELVRRRRPHAVICTHFLPLNLLAREKRKGRLEAPLYAVVTDYTGHIYWVDPYVDAYFVATSETGQMLVQRGAVAEAIRVSGIPIDPAIAEPKFPLQARQRHQIDQAPVVTLLGGGLAVERVEQIVNGLIDRGLKGTLLVVAGRNEKLQEGLTQVKSHPNLDLRVLGFIDYLDDLIAASDLIITKAGGLIVSEIMARQMPMVVIDPIPGQEEWNADYVVSVGAGVQLRLIKMVPLAVENLLNSPSRLAELSTGAALAGRPQAAIHVATMVLEDIR
jgi:processive 1,2-diacylglycerol beta-glucosyltransferase